MTIVEGNLDRISAEIGFDLSDEFKEKSEKEKKELEGIITKVLGILIEDGLFAYAIWLESENKEPHKAIISSSLKLLKDIDLIPDNQNDLRNAILKNISDSVQKTLLARQVLEKMLVYAKYRAKALQKG